MKGIRFLGIRIVGRYELYNVNVDIRYELFSKIISFFNNGVVFLFLFERICIIRNFWNEINNEKILFSVY